MNIQRLLFFFLCFTSCAQAQDLTGIWRGHFRSNQEYERLLGIDDRYKMEVQIAQKNNTFQAVTYSYKSYFFYGKADADGNEDSSTNKIRLRELKIVELKTMAGDDACIMDCHLKYSKLGDEEFLEGTYTSANTRTSKDCGSGNIFLHKVAVSDFHEEPFVIKREKEIENEKKRAGATGTAPGKKNNSPSNLDKKTLVTRKPLPAGAKDKPSAIPKNTANIPANRSPRKGTARVSPDKAGSTPKKDVQQPASHAPSHQAQLAKSHLSTQPVGTVKNDSIGNISKAPIPIPIPQVLTHRANELVRSITVRTADVELNIYDDGVIDNDTVSVYFDKKLIVSNARLTDKPIIVKIHLDPTSGSHELVMVAENEGDIPPNTSLMIVKAGNDQFEVRIVSTEQKNAVVVFSYKKPEE